MIPILDQKLYRSPGLLRGFDSSLETIDVVGDAINRNDLSADRQALLVGQSFPQDFIKLAFVSEPEYFPEL